MRVSTHILRRLTFTARLPTLCRSYSAASPSSDPPIIENVIPAPHTGSIKVLLLSNPKSKNAISTGLLAALKKAVEPIASGEDVTTRALVIGSAVPGAFCAGADLKERRTMTPQQVKDFLDGLRGTLKTLESLPIPTISAISGLALGGGLELALATDLRVVSPSAQVGLPETRLGIIPGAGGTYRLPQLIGRSRALEIILSGRRVGAIEAVQIGLANRIVDIGMEDEGRTHTIDAAIEVAQEICMGGPIAVKVAKRVVTACAEEAENNGYLDVVGTKDRDEALLAFKEKRRPSFKGE